MFRRHFGPHRHGEPPEEHRERRGERREEHREHRGWHGHHGRWHEHGPEWFAPPGRERFDRPHRGRGPFGGGPFGDDPFDEDGGGRRRHRRGDIKFALLELIAEQPRHGYDLIKELERRYGGFYRPSPGSVYPTLQLLEDEGHVTSESSEGKRVYTITDSGRQLLAERGGQREPEEGGRRHGFRGPSPELHELRESVMALSAGVMQAARHGTPDQIRAILKLLDGTRREIYAVLAKDEAE